MKQQVLRINCGSRLPPYGSCRCYILIVNIVIVMTPNASTYIYIILTRSDYFRPDYFCPASVVTIISQPSNCDVQAQPISCPHSNSSITQSTTNYCTTSYLIKWHTLPNAKAKPFPLEHLLNKVPTSSRFYTQALQHTEQKQFWLDAISIILVWCLLIVSSVTNAYCLSRGMMLRCS